MSQSYYIKTFGCQMNVSDSERIAAVLENNGLKAVSNINEADFVIFNTCGVRQMAEDRVYGQIHNLKVRKPLVKIILTGCLANRKDVQKRLHTKVNLFTEIKDFAPSIKCLINEDSEEQYQRDYLKVMPKHKNSFQAYIPIMTGCNNFCAYCVVPYARGREVSRPAEEIIKEIKKLVKNGYKEITMLGQNVNSYNDKKNNFSELLGKIEAIPGYFWINFISNQPKDVTDEMIEAVTKLPKVCECFHLPVQSGNDKILTRMNRKYTAKQYLSLIKKIRSAYRKYKPEKLFSITSDIIVGFPGETKEKFLASAEVMKKAKYDMVYFGQYSPRPGTTAWKFKDNVSKKEKMLREKYLNEILKKTSSDNNKKYVGKIFEVLVENKHNGSYFGKTRTMKNVKLIADKKDLVGQFAKVKITKANIWNLEGKIIK